MDARERSTDNYVFGMHDYATDQGCANALRELQEGKTELSRRRSKPLDLDERKSLGLEMVDGGQQDQENPDDGDQIPFQ